MNGVMNATNDELDAIVSSGERLAGWCALLIVAALVTEAILVFVSLSPLGVKIGTFVTDSLIAAGVFGELFFHKRSSHAQGELLRRSNAKLEDAYTLSFLADSAASSAHSLAASAQSELAKAVREATQLRLDLETERRKHAGRVVSAEVIENLKTLKGIVPWITLIEGTSTESSWFSHDLMMAFIEAGVGVERYEGTRKASGTGLMLYLPEGLANLADNPLYKALGPLGPMSAQSMPLASDADKTAPMLLVGEKAPNFVDPPGWLKRPKPAEE
jgi:hypothetical protein